MNLRRIDLNLLVVFDSLVQERSITRAAEKLAMSQPAVSHALSRLRSQLDDPLLVRSGNTMQLSPRALELHETLHINLLSIDRALEKNPRFDPFTSQSEFTIATTDYVETLLLPKILKILNQKAPGIRLHTRNLASDLPFDDIDNGVVDLVLCRAGKHPKYLRSKPLVEDRFLCAMAKSNPLSRKKLTFRRYLNADHLLVSPESNRKAIVDKVLSQQGEKRRIIATVPHFLVALPAVAETNLIVTAPARLLETIGHQQGLHTTKVPVELTLFTISMLWHQRNEGDMGLAWLRQTIIEITSQL